MNCRKLMRSDLVAFAKKMADRGEVFDVEAYTKLLNAWKDAISQLESLQAKRNQISKTIGMMKKNKEDAASLVQDMHDINQNLVVNSELVADLKNKLEVIEHNLPNIAHDSVPDGLSENNNVVLSRHGEIREFDFDVLDHVDLGESLNGMDFEVSRSMSGARFCFYMGKIAKLHRVLANWMLDLHIERHGYLEANTPFLVNKGSLFNSGQLPKFENDLFFYDNLGLIPTAEVSLVNYAADKIFSPQELPLKLVAHTPCFRKEAGSYGKDTRGVIRMHQFEKVELVQIVLAENSYDALEEICSHSQAILQKLDLPYQVVALAKGDLGFCAAKTYDLEVWLPSQNCYREIASISNCEGFQARRMQSRVKFADKSIENVHTLNGSGLAISRTLVAILENYQNKDGSITMPEILRDRLGFDKISPV